MTAGERPFRYLSGRGSTNSIRSDTRLQKCTYGASPSGWPSSSVRGELEGHGGFPTHRQHAQVGLPSQLYHKAPSGEGAGGNQWLWRAGETGGLESSGTRVVGKTSHRASKERGISRLLQPAVSGPKARRSVAAGHRSERAERVFGDRIVPDGDSGDDKVSTTNRRMGNVGRPIGCVPPHSPSRSFQEILPIYGGKTNVPVCGHAIRTSLGTTDLTRLGKDIKMILEKRQIVVHTYLDDFLIRAKSAQEASEKTLLLLEVLISLGLVVNVLKSELTPSQTFKFVGYGYNLQEGVVFPYPDRVEEIHAKAIALGQQPYTTAAKLSSFLGLLAATEKMVPRGRLHMRHLQRTLKAHWCHPQPLSTRVPIRAKGILSWWANPENLLAKAPLHRPTPEVTVYTDASMRG